MTYSAILSALVAFAITYFATKYAIRYFRFVGLVTTDVHKKNKPLVPYSAGVPLMIGLSVGLLVYIFINVFVYGDVGSMTNLFAAITSIFLIGFVGLLDDLNSVQVKVKGFVEGKKGLKRWQKPLMTLLAALPMMAIMAGTTNVYLPVVGNVELGILYPLLIVPAAVLIASNAINMLGGFNGLELCMALVYTLSLGVFALMSGSEVASIIFFTAFAALLGVARFNLPPAKILSGDSFTYILGAVIAVGAIIGNMERAVLITMIPFVVQAALKFYSHRKLGSFASDLGILQKDGTIVSKYGKNVYSWTHVFTRSGRYTEAQIVAMMMAVQIVFSLIPFLNVL